MSTAEIDDEKQRESLALEIACGRSIRLWAKRNGVDATLARARLDTFESVHRTHVADRNRLANALAEPD